ncbi:MAG: hypothetical protein ACRELV_11975 [Longimicrobiales bacterium]
MKCPECGADASGAYCPACGAPASSARCRGCDAPLEPGAHYCTQCGAPTRTAASNLPWIVAGVALVALIVVLLVPTLFPAPESESPVPGAPFLESVGEGGGAGVSPPPLTGTPREQADRLFNRVMQAAATGNRQEVTFFLPMAIAAYRQAGELDADGLYHLGVLQNEAGEYEEASRTAERILATSPDHLLGLAVAAQSAEGAGDTTAADAYWARFLEAYDEEAGRPLPEYTDHRAMLAEYRAAGQEGSR